MKLIDDLRPVNVLLFLRKVLEQVVYKHLMYLLITNKLLPSTATPLIKVTNHITKNMKAVQVTYLALLVYSKPCSCINRELMIFKFKYYLVQRTVIRLFRYYFEDRTQRVGVNYVSGELVTPFGVPQGSSLGRLLHSMYVVHLPQVLKAGWSMHCYDEDVQYYKSCPPEECNS